MQQINIDELRPHPRNTEFFDDMSGEKWTEFLESVKTSGVIEPIVITADKVIVSGHQRVRACKELGMLSVPYDTRTYENEDQILKDLLETNIRQRGDIGGSAKKVGLRIRELERLYGIRQGSANPNGKNQYIGDPNYLGDQITQSDFANQLGMSDESLRNYKLLADMIPELEELLDTGIVTKTTALAIMKNLTATEQEELISSLDTTKRITQKQVQQYIDENNSLRTQVAEVDTLKAKVTANEDEQKKLKNRISELVQQKTEREIVTQEVDKPETLAKIESLRKQLDEKISQNADYSQRLIEKEKLLNQAMGSSTSYQLVSHCSEITLKMLNFVKDMSKYDYMAESFNEIPTATRIEYEKCIRSVKKWADRILEVIDHENNIIDA